MYKLLVVDDEETIRTGITKGIGWSEIGFEVCGAAENGVQAVELMKTTVPDVILTDVCMPKMNGIELMEYINEKLPSAKIVILSGYKEFDYVQKALKNKAYDYLLKPTHIKSFIELFSKLKKEMDSERQTADKFEELKENINENKPYLRQIFLEHLIKGECIQKTQMENKLKLYDLDFLKGNLVVFVMEVDSDTGSFGEFSEENKHLLDLFVLNSANSIKSELVKAELFSRSSGEIIGICNVDDGITNVVHFFEKVQDYLYDRKKSTISIGISKQFSDLILIDRAYAEAKKSIEYRICLGVQNIIFYSDIETMMEKEIPIFSFDSNKINNYILNVQIEPLKDYMVSVFENIENKMFGSFEFIDINIQKVVFEVETNFYQYGILINDILNEINTSFSDLYRLNTLFAKCNWIVSVVSKVAEKVDEKRSICLHGVIVAIQKYVDENYCDNGISLERIADEFNKSPQYVSKLFKESLGKNFSDYLTDLRIARAKELLLDFSVKISDISDKIGYADVSYFTKKFKNAVGISPSQFRSSIVVN